MKNALSTVTKLSNADWLKNSEWMLDLVKTPQPSFEKPLPLPFQSRLIRVDEINEEGHQAYRQALANVYGTLDAEQAVRFYICSVAVHPVLSCILVWCPTQKMVMFTRQ